MASDQGQKFGTFPRAAPSKYHNSAHEEEVETLVERFSDLRTNPPLSPPLSVSSFKSTFSTSQNGSTPATSPEMGGQNELSTSSFSTGRKSGYYGRRFKATSRESVRSIFSSSSSASLKGASLFRAEENEWEETLEQASSRASWQSSINHRPRQHQMTWPKVFSSSPSASSSSAPPVEEGLWLEHMFVDATSEDGRYAESTYSGFPVDGGSRQASDAEGLASRPSFSSKFGSFGRIKGRRPRILANPALAQVLGTSSLGRAASMRRTRQNAAEVWSMGRRRSSAAAAGSFSTEGAARMMPTTPQDHSRENSRADEIEEDFDIQDASWIGVDPFTSGYPIRHDGFAFDGSGELIHLRFGSWRRGSQDDLAFIRHRSSSISSNSPSSENVGGPVFNLHPFKRPSVVGRRRFSRSAAVPDVPEAASSASGEGEWRIDEGWCRRRSTLINVPFDPRLPPPPPSRSSGRGVKACTF
ncbi:hypothetical protein NDA13_006081 [Ustilago tritici]|nr:hypothetical protein NDA13_006081 [Ustilago tritici]